MAKTTIALHYRTEWTEYLTFDVAEDDDLDLVAGEEIANHDADVTEAPTPSGPVSWEVVEAPTRRTPVDARYRPQVGDVATAADDGTTLTVVAVHDTGWLSVRQTGADSDTIDDMHTFGWADNDDGVWSWTPGGAS